VHDLLPFDLTRAGVYSLSAVNTDVKQLALYIQDQITKGNWSLNLGLREISTMVWPHKEANLALESHITSSANTVLRVSYARYRNAFSTKT